MNLDYERSLSLSNFMSVIGITLAGKTASQKKEHSSRHHLHKNRGHVNVIYTPGFFLNGKEWNKRFKLGVPTFGDKLPRVINVILCKYNLKVSYSPSQNNTRTTLNVAILRFGYQSPIQSGENSHRVLNEDFVLLSHPKKAGENNSLEIELPKQVSPMAKNMVWQFGLTEAVI